MVRICAHKRETKGMGGKKRMYLFHRSKIICRNKMSCLFEVRIKIKGKK